MTGYQEIKKQLLPLIKGIPFVLTCFIIALFIAKKVISYTPEKYSVMAKIKLDDQKAGISNNNLYTDFDVFSTENKIAAEIEIIKSPIVIKAALDSINLNTSIYRVGKIRSTLLFDNSPISIEHKTQSKALIDKKLRLVIHPDSSYTLTGPFGKTKGQFGKLIPIDGDSIIISHNTQGYKLQLIGSYEIIFHSQQSLINMITENLTVLDMDKGVAVLRVVYKDEHPKRAADIVNAICKSYIQDYISNRSEAAHKTLRFIEAEIEKISRQLQRAENKIERFKGMNDIVNTKQQTETGLREISKMKLSLINLEMNEKAIIDLEKYISNGDYFDETAINFGFGDLLMTELVKKLKLWNDERLDLTIKYTAEHEKVKVADQKIAEIKTYIKEAIHRNKKEISAKKEVIKKSLAVLNTQFDGLPTKEKNITILNRNFNLHEEVYNFLSQKKVEASIAQAASISFHRIIQYASVPKKPIAPNKTLILFITGLLSLFLSIGVIYLRQFISAKIISREDLEKRSALPIVGVIKNGDNGNDTVTIAKAVLMNRKSSPLTICISSTIRKEGKSYVSSMLRDSFQKLGIKTCLVTFEHNVPDIKYPKRLSKTIVLSDKKLHGSIKKTNKFFKEISKKYKVIIIDAPSAAISIDSIQLMKIADLTLYVTRSKFTNINYAQHADIIAEEYGIDNIKHVVNGVHKASNYSGNFIGQTFMPNRLEGGVSKTIKTYFNLYFK